MELSCVMFHLKPSLRIVAIYGAHKWSKFLHLSSRWNKFLVSLFISIQFFFPWVAGCHLIIWDVFHKTISRLFFSLLVFNNSILAFVVSVISQDLVSLRSGVIVMLLFSTHHIVLSRSCYFLAYPFNRSVMPSSQVLPILSSFWLPSQPECRLKSFLPLVPFIQ